MWTNILLMLLDASKLKPQGSHLISFSRLLVLVVIKQKRKQSERSRFFNMKLRKTIIALSFLIDVFVDVNGTPIVDPDASSPPGSLYIVTCKDDTEKDCYDEIVGTDVEIVHMISGTKYFVVSVHNEEEYNSLMELDDVDEVEEDKPRYFVEPEPELDPSTIVRNRRLSQSTPYGIQMVNAVGFHQIFNKRGEGIRVCIIDSGLDFFHEDLGGNAIDGVDVDPNHPWNEDSIGHGTHVAGTIAAANNDIGVIGVAPNVDLFIVRGKTWRSYIRCVVVIEAIWFQLQRLSYFLPC